MRKNRLSHDKFFYIALKEFNLSPLQGLMMHLIHGLSKQWGWAYPSKETIAEKLNISRPTVYKCLRELEVRGLIERKPKRPPGMTTTVIRPTNIWIEFYKNLNEIGFD